MNTPTWKKPATQVLPRMQPWTLPETARGWYTSLPGLATLAEMYTSISLDQMEAVSLLNRKDTKFVMSGGQLLKALVEVQQDYWMMSVQSQRLNHYRTLYFDTPDFDLYRVHVNGKADRYKVRSREYTDSSLSFLEVKHKTNKGRTIKDRFPTAQQVAQITLEAGDWLQGIYPHDYRVLEPKLWTTFTRLTLVSKRYCERVTLDVDLTFYTGDRVAHLDGIAIAEVKTEAHNRTSSFLANMHSQRIYSRGFSKYCIGVSMLYDQVKKNAMKPKMLFIERISRGVAYHE